VQGKIETCGYGDPPYYFLTMAHNIDDYGHNDSGRDNISAHTDLDSKEALLDRIEELEAFYNHSPAACVTLDPEGRFVDVNLTTGILLRAVSTELIGRFLYDFVIREDRDILYLHLRGLFKGEKPQRCELRIRKNHPKVIHVVLESIYVQNRKGRDICRSVIMDITDRVRAEERFLQMAESASARLSELEAIYASAPVGMCVFDENFRYIRINERLAKINGSSVEAHIGRTPWEVVPALAPLAESVFRQVLETGRPQWNVEFSGTTPGQPGGVRFWNENWLPMKDPEGRILGVNVVAEEITEHKKMLEELHTSRDRLEQQVRERTDQFLQANKALELEVQHRKRFEEALRRSTSKILREAGQRRSLSKRLVETIEKDRRDMAAYLHDEISQMLISLKMDLELARGEFGRPDGPSNEMLERAEAKALEVMRKVRDVSRDLMPDVLDTLGLDRALRSLIENFGHDSGLKVHFHCKDTFKDIDPDKTLALYRITQEALANMAKYARATEVFVSLIMKDDSLRLSVEDDGIGFNVDEIMRAETDQGALGIRLMQERAVLAGGDLTVESRVGEGTIVSAEIPAK
jgi:PAS domain S-box-containing protein